MSMIRNATAAIVNKVDWGMPGNFIFIYFLITTAASCNKNTTYHIRRFVLVQLISSMIVLISPHIKQLILKLKLDV